MIDTTIEIRSTDSEWLIKSLEYMLHDLKEQQKIDLLKFSEDMRNTDLNNLEIPITDD